MSSGGLWSWPSRPCEWPAKRLRGRPVSRTVTLRRARPSCRAAARPAKLPPMMMTSSMVMGSVLWMEGGGLGLARNIVERYALFLLRRRGFRRPVLDRPRDSAGQTIVIGAVLLGSTGRQRHQALNGRLQELLRQLLVVDRP